METRSFATSLPLISMLSHAFTHSFPSFNINSPNRHSPSSQCRPASGQTRPSPCSTTHASSPLPRLLLLLLLPRGRPHPPPCYCRAPRSAPTGPEAPFLASASCLSGFTGAFLRASISASLSFESVRPWSEGLSERDGTGRGGGGVGECAAYFVGAYFGVAGLIWISFVCCSCCCCLKKCVKGPLKAFIT